MGMGTTMKMWELKNTRNEHVIALLESYDMGQILAKRLQLDTFSLEQRLVTSKEIPLEKIHFDVKGIEEIN